MLTIPLVRLEREGALEIEGEIPPDHPSWEGTDLHFATPLGVSAQARWISSGEATVHLSLSGRLNQECRRCLEPILGRLDLEAELLFIPEGEWEEGDDEARPLPEGATELDLTEAIREEVILAQSPFALCRPDCRGLCPRCGANLNEETCQCFREETDPRWDALRALRPEGD